MSESNYRRIRLVGKGSFGQAFLVQHVSSGKQYIMKKINTSGMSPQERNEAQNEVRLLSQLKHTNIVEYVESFPDVSGNLCIVMEFAEKGDLHEAIKRQSALGTPFAEEQVLEWLLQICLAIKYCHDHKILHRDIKTQNIFLTASNRVKIGDFGIARVLKNTLEYAKTLVGTPYYMSPELCQEKPYNNKSDVWSIGCVLYELLTMRHAFDAQNMRGLVVKILRGNYPPVPTFYSMDLRNLVGAMFERDPRKRPSVNAVLRTPIMRTTMNRVLSSSMMQREGFAPEIKQTPRSLAPQVAPAPAPVRSSYVPAAAPPLVANPVQPQPQQPVAVANRARASSDFDDAARKERIRKQQAELDYLENLRKQQAEREKDRERDREDDRKKREDERRAKEAEFYAAQRKAYFENRAAAEENKRKLMQDVAEPKPLPAAKPPAAPVASSAAQLPPQQPAAYAPQYAYQQAANPPQPNNIVQNRNRAPSPAMGQAAAAAPLPAPRPLFKEEKKSAKQIEEERAYQRAENVRQSEAEALRRRAEQEDAMRRDAQARYEAKQREKQNKDEERRAMEEKKRAELEEFERKRAEKKAEKERAEAEHRERMKKIKNAEPRANIRGRAKDDDFVAVPSTAQRQRDKEAEKEREKEIEREREREVAKKEHEERMARAEEQRRKFREERKARLKEMQDIQVDNSEIVIMEGPRPHRASSAPQLKSPSHADEKEPKPKLPVAVAERDVAAQENIQSTDSLESLEQHDLKKDDDRREYLEMLTNMQDVSQELDPDAQRDAAVHQDHILDDDDDVVETLSETMSSDFEDETDDHIASELARKLHMDEPVVEKFRLDGNTLRLPNLSERDSLAARIENLRMFIEKAVGVDAFLQAYLTLQNVQQGKFDDDDRDDGNRLNSELERVLGTDNMKIASLINQLIFCEDMMNEQG